MEKIKDSFNLQAKIPSDFSGLPQRNTRKSWFVDLSKLDSGAVDLLWELFERAITLADEKNNANKFETFKKEFDQLFVDCFSLNGVSWGITFGLFWIRPKYFISLDGPMRDFLKSRHIVFTNDEMKEAGEYLKKNEEIKSQLPFKDIPDIDTLFKLSSYVDDLRNKEKSKNKKDHKKKDNKKELEDDNESVSKIASMGIEDFKKYKNFILYGPPGTGKTYNAKTYAVAMCEQLQIDEDLKSKYESLVIPKYKALVKDERIAFITFHQSYGYEEFIEGIKASTKKGNIHYEVQPGVFKSLCAEARKHQEKSYVLIIDEINRGNISKIFGELITLIEETKREGMLEEITVKLPYSSDGFCVPKNVYILGTMNTADRSIALIDTALRRRFQFIEMMPDLDLIKKQEINIVKYKEQTIDIYAMLKAINERIEILYNREHTIGHAFFMKLKNVSEEEQFVVLKSIFKNNLIPLLQEYFYEDYSKIRLILGDNAKSNTTYQFIKENINKKEVFMGDKISMDDFSKYQYEINEEAFNEIKSYIGIYESLEE